MEWELKLVVSGEMALNFAQDFDLSIYALLNQIDWSDDHLKKERSVLSLKDFVLADVDL